LKTITASNQKKPDPNVCTQPRSGSVHPFRIGTFSGGLGLRVRCKAEKGGLLMTLSTQPTVIRRFDQALPLEKGYVGHPRI